MNKILIILFLFTISISCYYYTHGGIAPPYGGYHHRSYTYHSTYPAYHRLGYTTPYGVPYGYNPQYDYGHYGLY